MRLILSRASSKFSERQLWKASIKFDERPLRVFPYIEDHHSGSAQGGEPIFRGPCMQAILYARRLSAPWLGSQFDSKSCQTDNVLLPLHARWAYSPHESVDHPERDPV